MIPLQTIFALKPKQRDETVSNYAILIVYPYT